DIGYRFWLEMTPWTHRKPLPGGPVHLVWEDIVVLGALLVPAWYGKVLSPWIGVTVFLCCYATVLASTFGATNAPVFGYVVYFGLGLVIRLWPWPESQALVSAFIALVTLVGLRRQLVNFPWPNEKLEQFRMQTPAQINEMAARSGKRLGWPYDRLGPKA